MSAAVQRRREARLAQMYRSVAAMNDALVASKPHLVELQRAVQVATRQQFVDLERR